MITMDNRGRKTSENRVYSPVGTILVLLAISACAVSGDHPRPPEVSPPVERAILSGDWDEMLKALGPVGGPNAPPVIRMIAGHACLATNRNNDALKFFASTLNDADRQAWDEWTKSFMTGHGRSAVAQYFRGDALARQEDWQAAAACFDEALRLDPQCYPASNARGVAAHAVGNTVEARMHFLKAARIKKDFADAYASRGTLNVYLHSVARDRRSGQEQPFEAARRCSRDDDAVVTLIGRGCMLYGEQNYDGALACFQAVPDASELAPLARRNALAAEMGKLERSLIEARKLGTFVQSMELNLANNQKAVVRMEPSPRGMNFSANWGITGVDINLGIITIHVGPRPVPDDKGGNKGGDKGGDKGGGKGGDKGGSKGGDKGGGKNGGKGGKATTQSETAVLPIELLPTNTNIIDLPDMTGVPTPGGMPQLPMPVRDLYSNSANALAQVTSAVDQQLASVVGVQGIAPSNNMSRMPTAPQVPVGGVNGNVAGIASNRGAWRVCSVYGLLYPVPTEVGSQGSE